MTQGVKLTRLLVSGHVGCSVNTTEDIPVWLAHRCLSSSTCVISSVDIDEFGEYSYDSFVGFKFWLFH